MTKPDPRIAIVGAICDVEETSRPFGKRWRHEGVVLDAEHVVALQAGKLPALDVQEEYVVFLKLEAAAGGWRGVSGSAPANVSG